MLSVCEDVARDHYPCLDSVILLKPLATVDEVFTLSECITNALNHWRRIPPPRLTPSLGTSHSIAMSLLDQNRLAYLLSSLPMRTPNTVNQHEFSTEELAKDVNTLRSVLTCAPICSHVLIPSERLDTFLDEFQCDNNMFALFDDGFDFHTIPTLTRLHCLDALLWMRACRNIHIQLLDLQAHMLLKQATSYHCVLY